MNAKIKENYRLVVALSGRAYTWMYKALGSSSAFLQTKENLIKVFLTLFACIQANVQNASSDKLVMMILPLAEKKYKSIT